MKRILACGAVLALLGALTATAGASHPTIMCLDVEPDEHFGVGNDNTVDYLTASVGATDAGHPPEQEGCVISDTGSAEGTVVHFEVTGDNDPDDSDSPETPDLTCTVPADSNDCTVEPPEGFLHDQEIAAWIDFDSQTVELDREEGPDEATEPGGAEPDATDVALWRWTHEEPQPECNDGRDNDDDGTTDYPDDMDCAAEQDTSESAESPHYEVCSNGIDDDGDNRIDRGDSGCYGPHDRSEARPNRMTTILYGRGAFSGSYGDERPRCGRRRTVTVKQVTNDRAVRIGSDVTNERGEWRVRYDRPSGRYVAIVAPKQTVDGWGDPLVCRRDASPTIRL